jgi:hypothetical protein
MCIDDVDDTVANSVGLPINFEGWGRLESGGVSDAAFRGKSSQ